MTQRTLITVTALASVNIIYLGTIDPYITYYIPVLQVMLVYPLLHPPVGHVPAMGSHGWLMQWHVSLQLCPYFPESHTASNDRNIIHVVCVEVLIQ